MATGTKAGSAKTNPSNFSSAQNALIRKWTAAGSEVRSIVEMGRSAKNDPRKVDTFRARFNILEKYYSKFENLSDLLYELNDTLNDEGEGAAAPYTEFPDSTQGSILQNVRSYYLECQELNVNFSKPDPQGPTSLQNVTLSQEPGGGSSSLPKIAIPKFGGEFQNWVQFRDTFDSLVHNSSSLTATQKFHYLLAALSGEARSVIANLSISDANYPLAYQALKDAYDNKRVLAAVYLNKVLSFKPITGKPTPENLQIFLSNISDAVAAFKMLKLTNESDFILFTLAVRNLPAAVREDFEFRLKSDEFPSMDKLTSFVRERQLSVQLADPATNFSLSPEVASEKKGKGAAKSKATSSPKTSLMTNATTRPKDTPRRVRPAEPQTVACFICDQTHGLLSCPKFHFMTPQERFESLKSFGGCRICLAAKHGTKDCKSTQSCRFCKGKHNSLTCLKVSPSAPSSRPEPSTSKPSSANLFGTTMNTMQAEDSTSSEPQVILATAWADVLDARGKYQKVRLVLDSASQYSYMTHRCLSRLGLALTKTPRKISCLGGVLFDAAKGVAQCEFSSPDHQITVSTEVVVVKNITSSLPTVAVPPPLRPKYANFLLADRAWFKPSRIDVLLGGDLYPEVVQGGFISVGDHLPKLLPTIFGHVIMGRYTTETPQPLGTSLFSLSHCEDNLCFDLQQFWQIEEVAPTDSPSSQEEDLAEQSFVNHHYRLPDGRFGVRIPFKSPVPDLSASEAAAKKRFFNLEAKFKRNPDLKAQYTSFLQEYENLQHMSPALGSPSSYIIPHHGVFNKVKLRVVFDASCSTPAGSLNDYVLVGKPLQNDIRNILLNFRSYKVAFITDAVKMFRQIEVSPEDRKYQHIFWRSDPAQPLQRYELNTVTYGMACSPFLALRCLKQLEMEHAQEFPLAAQALSTQLYVDDIAAGSSSEQGALELQQQLTTVMSRGGFQLAKWASNSQAVLNAVQADNQPPSSVDLSTDESSAVKVLGLKWEPGSDTFSYSIQPPDVVSTKRGLLSTVAKIFDPLGFLAPSVVLFKVLIQKLWSEGLGWDAPVPDHILKIWRELTAKLHLLSTVRIDRWVLNDPPYTYQIVGFSDASETAYCAAVYCRIIGKNSVVVRLLTAKTRVAPTKRLTIPRLELCGALLLAKLIQSLRQFHDTVAQDAMPPVYFTDSMVALAWIRLPPHKLKVFVSNRVAEIQSISSVDSWRHVAGSENPADLGSRGVLPDKLVDNSLWWFGPPWLARPPETWPSAQIEAPSDLPETKPNAIPVADCFLACSTRASQQALVDWMKRFSSYLELLRVVAVLRRGIANFRNRPNVRDGPILPADLDAALVCCVKAVQIELLNDQNRSKGIPHVYSNLAPFQDENGVWRVGGRIRHAQIPYNQKHPILLPAHSHFTLILVDFYHRCFLHPSPNTLQALLQTRFWIVPSLRRLVRHRTAKCVDCRKRNAKPLTPPMGDLPAYRLQTRRAFAHTGVDFAGPFVMRESLRRKAQTAKIYLALFVCMETKALHLEPVTQLSTEAFLASFDRFIARRGLPEKVFSDNGLNFVGASRKLKEFYQWYHSRDTKLHIIRNGARQGIEWSFNPPHAPHFGGLWEAGVRSVKRQMCDVTGETPLTFEEFTTLFAKIEAILNSRPLCPLSSDPEEAEYLSPGHFLVGAPLVAYPEPSHLDRPEHLLNRWQVVKKMYETFWKRWRQQYLTTLQKRTKWTRASPNLAVGDLVLVRGPSQSAHTEVMHWPVARITATHPGADGVVRVVTIRTANNSMFQRPVVELIPLFPLPDPDEDREE